LDSVTFGFGGVSIREKENAKKSDQCYLRVKDESLSRTCWLKRQLLDIRGPTIRFTLSPPGSKKPFYLQKGWNEL
jgi:hypothetical protein